MEEINSWIIASKSVSISVTEEKNLESYHNESRYEHAYLFAVAWFEILKSKITSLECLKKDLKNKTLVGEYCGNPTHQHLIKYNKTDILFFAIVDHNSLNSCIPPNEAFDLFKKYSLSTVLIQNCKKISNLKDLKNLLKEIFHFVSKSPIEIGGEGSVLYFVKLSEKFDEVLSLCKIKTLEYLIFRGLREKRTQPLHIYKNYVKELTSELLFFHFGEVLLKLKKKIYIHNLNQKKF